LSVANAWRKRDWQPIFRTTRDRDRRDADEVAGGRKGRLNHRWRIDSDLDALAQEIVDESVQRLVGPVAHIIVIARKEGDAKVGRLHRAAL